MLAALGNDAGRFLVAMQDRRKAFFIAEERRADLAGLATVRVDPGELGVEQVRGANAVALGEGRDQRTVELQQFVRRRVHLCAISGVPWVWKDSMVFNPQAWPFLRSASVQVIGFQSGARMSRALAFATSTRLPPGS